MLFHSKLDRDGFIEDARARANDSPPPYDAKFLLVQPRLKGRGFLPSKKTSFDPIKKSQEPDCGTYTTDKAFSKIVKRIKVASISKYNLPQIQELEVKKKKWVPGAGSYQWEKCFNKISRVPMFRKGKY